EYHQFSTYTKKNRYPELFNECKKFFRNRTDLKILSFGCSTGEEVESLGLFLTDASITGVDINKYCIQQCNKKYKHPLWNFIHVSSAEFLNSANYDAVFCLAVFQHPENRYKKNNSSKKYPFSKFEDQLEGLDKKLKPGGLLFIDHSDFSFLQTRVSKKYTVLKTAPNRILRNRPSFDSTNTRIADFSFNYRIFQKSKS
ncbi:MAG TPA: methyltransferase domain-containing protein, partial [Bacteroidia bacterium]|nr:methyltransferase domain-containing protein [Bacteroidia bacterium]